jgi:U3 small nucleolar RNA-associated protein 21
LPLLQGVCHTGPSFRPTCLLHPDTYLNKVLLGGASGELQLWNIATRHKLHTFKGW